ncbi:MAG: heavy metal-responsive transcriptional regulator, partial [Gemmatimonadetes bacterium]|nr:heavy metal-responsive transcriptional regulator [Gemmatimonadota bacterium]
MLIGELAQATGVGVETLRFYEREGVLPDPGRNVSGYRLYDDDALRRVRFVLRAKALGFSLSETKELLGLRVSPGVSCEEVRRAAGAKLSDVERRIEELRGMQSVLAELIEACAAEHRTDDCPILDALDDARGDSAMETEASVPPREIDLIYFDGCPHVEVARTRLRAALGGAAARPAWREWDLGSDATPERFRQFPSPTVLIDGTDIEGRDDRTSALACRAGG